MWTSDLFILTIACKFLIKTNYYYYCRSVCIQFKCNFIGKFIFMKCICDQLAVECCLVITSIIKWRWKYYLPSVNDRLANILINIYMSEISFWIISYKRYMIYILIVFLIRVFLQRTKILSIKMFNQLKNSKK